MSPRWIDSHCHLTFDALWQQADGVLDRARAAGVAACVTIATDLSDAERALALSARHCDVYTVCGIHPHEAAKAPPGWIEALSALAARDDVYGVGETGLDYHYDFADRPTQHDVFARQLAIARRAGKPVVIHCREALDDALSVLAEAGPLPNVVFHCFTEDEAAARRILDRGFWISLTGVVTFRKSDALRRVAAMIPEDRLMIETDAPYLSPEPVRNVRPNEPAHLVHTARRIAAARGTSLEALSEWTTANTIRFFSLPEVRHG